MSWPIVEFGSLCSLQNGRAFKSSEWVSSGVPIVRIQNLNDDEKPFNYCGVKIEKKFHVKSGDLLFSWSGTPGTSFGAFFWNRGEAYLNQHIFRVDVDEKKVNKNYLRYAINSRLTQIIDKAHGGVGLKHITKGRLESTLIPAPPLKEQKRIAAILDKADAIRRKRQQAIELADEFLRAVFLDMFGDPVLNPKGFEKKKLSEVGEVITGNTPSRKRPEYYGDHIEWVKSDNINTPEHYLTTAKEFLSEAGAEVARIVPSNSLLITCIAGSKACIGNIAIANRPVAFNQQINALIPSSVESLLFLYGQLLYNKKLVRSASTNSMKGMVSKSKFSLVEVIWPSSDLRSRYSAIFEYAMGWVHRSEQDLVETNKLISSLTSTALSEGGGIGATA